MAGLISPPLFGKGEYVLRRIKLLLAVVAAMSMLLVMAAPAMADDFNRDCYPFCNDHRDFDGHNFYGHDNFYGNDSFLNDFYEDYDDDDDDDDDDDGDFYTFDDCELVSFYGEEAVFVCEF
jgi:hypothetical protein